MTSPLLTIAIPTYNRASCLERLLTVLATECAGVNGQIELIVSDNASTDHTGEVLSSFAKQWPEMRCIRHKVNAGMDANFHACVEHVNGKHFWLLGDDDIPCAGVLKSILALLETNHPDLLYLSSSWLATIGQEDVERRVDSLKSVRLNQIAFARRVHVWTTYLSGMIVNSDALRTEAVRSRRYLGTQVSQLSWVLSALRSGSTFIYVRTPCVLATENNTGGYRVLQVFGTEVPRIFSEMLPVPVSRVILERMATSYLPTLLWGLRQNRVGRFEQEDASEALSAYFGDTFAYRHLLLPIAKGSQSSAQFAISLARFVHRISEARDRIGERLTARTRLYRTS